MATLHTSLQARSVKLLAALFLLFGLTSLGASPTVAQSQPPEVKWQTPDVFEKKQPESVADLKALQEHVKKVIAKVMPVTVNLKVGPGQGGGVIISEDGYVLTAASCFRQSRPKMQSHL